MRFERNRNPMESMGIGREAYIKRIILDVIRDMENTKYSSVNNRNDNFKWLMWRRGIEVHRIEKMLSHPEGFSYKFFYQDCNGEEAHIMRTIRITEKEMSDYDEI